MKTKTKKVGSLQQKILLLLLGGLALGLSGSPSRYFRILRMIGKEWRDIERRNLARSIRALYQSQLVAEKHNADGTVTLVLTKEGKERALTYRLEEIEIKTPARWDGYWRIVLFDIPEDIKKLRDAFRRHLKRLGFYEFQKSVFIHPYDCSNEIDFLIEFYNARPYIRFVLAKHLDNELHIKKVFSL